jgi:hypothetical protein
MVHGVRTLVLAAGGGGDVITGSVLARALGLTEAPVLMSYSWDRLLFDPLPGPRTAAQFVGLRELAFNVRQVLPGTATVQPGNSSLPRLASQLQAPLILLDPVDGAIGMSRQVRATVEHFGIQRVAVVDVGGDVLTDGRDPGLRSPLADQLAFAACALTDLAVDLVIAAPGLDGELPRGVVLDRLAALGASRLTPFDAADTAPIRHVFSWHPSEASGLLVAAARGCRGTVEVRDAGDQVQLDNTTTELYLVRDLKVPPWSLGSELTGTRSLREAEHIVHRRTGISEISYETRKAQRLATSLAGTPTTETLAEVDRHAKAAYQRGATYLSLRRLSELVGVTTPGGFTELTRLLATHRPQHHQPTIYRT